MAERSYHHGDLRAALVNAARMILERDGYQTMSLRACAREAGVSHSAPLHHFKNLGELQTAVAASGFWDFVSVLGRAADVSTDPAERLIEMGRAYVGFGMSNPGLYRCMFGDNRPNTHSEELQDASSAAWMQLMTAVAKLSGNSNAERHAFLIWSISHGQVMLGLSGSMPDDLNPDVAIIASFETAIKGMMTSAQDLPS